MTAKGVIFHVDETGQHGWAVNLQNGDGGLYHWWNYKDNQGNWEAEDVANLPNYSSLETALTDTAGFQNTLTIRQTYQYSAAYYVDFNNGWYMPACGQLAELMQNRENVNSSLVTVNGTEIPAKWIWSSTESGSDSAWGWDEVGMYNPPKTSGYRVRSVRSF